MKLVGGMASLLITASLVTATWVVAARMLRRPRRRSRNELDAEAALRRHPAGRSRPSAAGSSRPGQAGAASAPRPAGPDDDPEFILALERLIRGGGSDPGA